MTITLPTYHGYTIDLSLKEFRKADPTTGIETIPFNTDRGDDMLSDYIESIDKTTAAGQQQWQQIIDYFG